MEALALSAPDFLALLTERPGIAMALLHNLIRRFRDADRIRIEFASAQTLGRVASRLCELAERHGEPDADGIAITLPISQEELAGWTGRIARGGGEGAAAAARARPHPHRAPADHRPRRGGPAPGGGVASVRSLA